MKILWDERKRLANLDKHGLDFWDLSPDFFAESTIYPARAGRLMAVGEFMGQRVVVVVFRQLGSEAVSVISMRPANAKEKRI